MYSDADVQNMIEQEGLDYAITHYISPDKIESHELRKLWREADEALKKILDYFDDDFL